MERFHFAVRAARGTLLFRTCDEARTLWDLCVRHLGQPDSLMLMPDHVHLLHVACMTRELLVVRRAYALWRNHVRGEHGPVWQRSGPPTTVTGRQKVDRARRYIALNPCRAGLCDDPLAWAFSTHRDAVGLAIPPVRRAFPDVHGHHSYVSSDPTCRVDGTWLPTGTGRMLGGQEVEAAVSALTRTTEPLLRRRGAPRTLLIRALKVLTPMTLDAIATFCGVDRRTVMRTPRASDVATDLISKVAGDDRFAALPPGDLVHTDRRWRRYSGRR